MVMVYSYMSITQAASLRLHAHGYLEDLHWRLQGVGELCSAAFEQCKVLKESLSTVKDVCQDVAQEPQP